MQSLPYFRGFFFSQQKGVSSDPSKLIFSEKKKTRKKLSETISRKCISIPSFHGRIGGILPKSFKIPGEKRYQILMTNSHSMAGFQKIPYSQGFCSLSPGGM